MQNENESTTPESDAKNKVELVINQTNRFLLDKAAEAVRPYELDRMSDSMTEVLASFRESNNWLLDYAASSVRTNGLDAMTEVLASFKESNNWLLDYAASSVRTNGLDAMTEVLARSFSASNNWFADNAAAAVRPYELDRMADSITESLASFRESNNWLADYAAAAVRTNEINNIAASLASSFSESNEKINYGLHKTPETEYFSEYYTPPPPKYQTHQIFYDFDEYKRDEERKQNNEEIAVLVVQKLLEIHPGLARQFETQQEQMVIRPTLDEINTAYRYNKIWDLSKYGELVKKIASDVGLTIRQVSRIRKELNLSKPKKKPI